MMEVEEMRIRPWLVSRPTVTLYTMVGENDGEEVKEKVRKEEEHTLLDDDDVMHTFVWFGHILRGVPLEATSYSGLYDFVIP